MVSSYKHHSQFSVLKHAHTRETETGNKKKSDQNSCNLGVIFHHDNAPVQTARMVTKLLDEYEHPRYYPDLDSCEFWLYPKMKDHLRGHRGRHYFRDKESHEAAGQRPIRHHRL
ncbi:mariner mos1 transposase [Plakobranchus ocellatus]|uniref:Mariner mos1 transposase n=1 Tax=Plakobranchus ocellatus TaxID=259542 RepID=A0AAV4B4I8_9GAST|nr:mariner mos1 transposase [Plakobranchus ocellatus]